MSHPRQELQALIRDLRLFLQNSIPQSSGLPSSDSKKFPSQVLAFSRETKGEKLPQNTTNARKPREQTISRNLGSLGPSEAIHANTFQNPYLAKNPEAIYGRVLQQTISPNLGSSEDRLPPKICEKSGLQESMIGEKPQTEAKVDLTSTASQWELHAMTSPSMPSPTILASHSKIIKPTMDVLLVLPQEKSHHRLFLENVARAITRTFASAVVVLFHENLFQSPQYPFIFAPAELLQKRFPKAQPHIPFREDNTTWVPLESLDFYDRDIHCKRALWMTIQRTFQ